MKDPDAIAFDAEMRKVVLSFPDSWPILFVGDLNGQLGRNRRGVTGKYTLRPDKSHGKHGKSLERALRDCSL